MNAPLQILGIRALRDNYVWMIRRDDDGAVVVVDPGEAAPVERTLSELRVGLAAILVTHHHADHVGGIAQLTRRHRVPVFAPATESILGRTHAITDGDVVRIDTLALVLRALHVPGHTLGAIAYEGEGVVFTGDTLFAAGCGRLFEGTPDQMHRSLQRLASLPGDTRVYCGHEYTVANLRFAQSVEPDNPDVRSRLAACVELTAAGRPCVPSTIAEERSTNPFLRVDVPEVRAAVERHVGRPLSDPVAVFASLREWKNHF